MWMGRSVRFSLGEPCRRGVSERVITWGRGLNVFLCVQSMLEVGKLKQSVLREYLSRAQQSIAAIGPDVQFDEHRTHLIISGKVMNVFFTPLNQS